MAEDNQIVPLAPANINPRSDEEFAAIKPRITSRQHKRSSKCFVYVLAGIVLLGIVLLVFALVVRPQNPDAELSFVRVKKLNYTIGTNGNNNTSASTFNMTLESELKIKNSNFGRFKYDNATTSVWCRGVSVGEAVLREGSVSARDTRSINVQVEVRSNKFLNGTNLTSDIDSGILELSSFAELNGRVNLLQIVKKTRSATMDCTFDVNLRSHLIENLVCN